MMRYIALVKLIALFLSAVLFIGCNDDAHDPDPVLKGDISDLVPSCSVRLNCSYSMSNSHINLEATPSIYIDMDRWCLKISKVDYYVDDIYCESVYESPYKFQYESREWYPAAHSLRADITITGDNIETMILPCIKVLDNSSAGTKAADIYFDYNYVTTGDELTINVCLNPERSEPGTKLVSAKATWNSDLIGETSSAPFEFKRIISEEPGSTHSLSASATYEQGGKKYTYSFTYPDFEICGPATSRSSYSICSRYRDFENGEKLHGKATVYKGDDVKTNYELEIYLDEFMIASTRNFPYEHEYLLSGLSKGQHTLKETWIRYDENWEKLGSVIYDETITITK